jgi:hypothetical protein
VEDDDDDDEEETPVCDNVALLLFGDSNIVRIAFVVDVDDDESGVDVRDGVAYIIVGSDGISCSGILKMSMCGTSGGCVLATDLTFSVHTFIVFNGQISSLGCASFTYGGLLDAIVSIVATGVMDSSLTWCILPPRVRL